MGTLEVTAKQWRCPLRVLGHELALGKSRYEERGVLTVPTYSKKHRRANQVYELKGRINREEGIPKYKHLIKGIFARKQKADPATSGKDY